MANCHFNEPFLNIFKAPALGSIWNVFIYDKTEHFIRRYAVTRNEAFIPALRLIFQIASGLWDDDDFVRISEESRIALYQCRVLVSFFPFFLCPFFFLNYKI